jgi:putative hydrolase of the HAD superfamily
MFEYLICDLDETLYPRRTGLMEAIGRRIHAYMTDRLGFTPDAAVAFRQRSLAQYGTALRGLQVEHAVDAEDYLAFVHAVPLENYLAPAPALDAMLGRIPLRKAILTNADTLHAQRVLERLGVAHHFPIVVDIHAVHFHCKPSREAYRCLLDTLETPGPACILVEDMARNLRPARDSYGMTTVLVTDDGADKPEGADHVIADLAQLEALIASILRA